MGGSAVRRPPPPPAPEPVVIDEAPRPGEARPGFLERAKRPIVLRVPRGYAALIALLLLGLLVLSYGVGFTRGQKDAKAQSQREWEQEQRLLSQGELRPVPTLGGPSAPAGSPTGAMGRNPASGFPINPGSPTAPRPVGPAEIRPVDSDPRVAEMNYLVLAEYPLDEARRLQAFLAQQQVETAVISRNNGRFHVVDLRPFAPGAVGGAEYQQHVNRLKQFGRVWKQSQRGPTDLSDLWPQKHRPGR